MKQRVLSVRRFAYTALITVVTLAAALPCSAAPVYQNGVLISNIVEGDISSASQAPPVLGPGLITFDEFDAPDLFNKTVRLTDAYAHLGVLFSGPGGNNGGAILDEGGNFGVGAHSGSQFLAFNRGSELHDGGVPTDPQTIHFDVLMASVSIYAAAGFGSAEFLISAYGPDGVLLASDDGSAEGNQWIQLSVSSNLGIQSVVLEEVGGDDAFVYDDLGFVPIPEPTTLSMLTIGAFGLLRRTRRRS